MAGSESNPQSWNPYSYAGNNPLAYSDPSGMRTTQAIEADQEDWQQRQSPYYQEAAAQDWATAPAMEPYELCVPCLQWIAAALAYQQAAALQTWAAAAPVTSYDSYQPDQDSGRGGGCCDLLGWAGTTVSVARAWGIKAERLAEVAAEPLVEEPALGIGLGLAATPIGLAIVGGLLAPCDSAGCTNQYNASDKTRSPESLGARRAQEKGKWISPKPDRSQDIRRGDEWQRAKNPHQRDGINSGQRLVSTEAS